MKRLGLLSGVMVLATAGLTFAASPATAPSTRSAEELIKEAFAGKAVPDVWGAGYDRIRQLATLPLGQRNEVAAAAARELSLFTAGGDMITEETVDQLIYRAPKDLAPADAALRELHFKNARRVALLQELANEHLYDDPRVIEPLINMLDYPGAKDPTRSTAAEALQLLSGRRYPADCQWCMSGEDNPKRRRYVAWWRDWLVKNQDRHPVLNGEVEQRIVVRVTAIAKQLRADLPDYEELKYFSPERLRVTHIDSVRLLEAIADSSISSQAFLRPTKDGNGRVAKEADFVQLRISATFVTPPAFTEPNRQELHSRVKGPNEEPLRESLPGTGILISVQAQSQDAEFLRKVRESLNRLPPAE